MALLQKAIYEDTEPPESYAHTLAQIKDRMNITGMFSLRQQSVLIQHQSKIAQSFWQDLLTAAALKQGKKPPVFEAELTGIDISVLDNNLTIPTVIADVSPVPSAAINRPRRGLPPENHLAYTTDEHTPYLSTTESPKNGYYYNS